jgi:hypothetical protein
MLNNYWRQPAKFVVHRLQNRKINRWINSYAVFVFNATEPVKLTTTGSYGTYANQGQPKKGREWSLVYSVL